MFYYADYYQATYILIVGMVLLLVVMAIIYKRTSKRKLKTGIIFLSIIVFICGGYKIIMCKLKTDQMLQEKLKQDWLFESYSGPTSIQYKDYPPIYIDSNADVLNITVASLKEDLDNTPEWLYKNATSITLTSQQYITATFPSLDVNSVGCASSSDRAIYTTTHAPSSILYHEFGHIYDYSFFITYNQSYQDIIPPDVLISNQNAVCEAVSESNSFDHCMSSYHETFADAMALYVESPDKLPPDLKAWMDSLPK